MAQFAAPSQLRLGIDVLIREANASTLYGRFLRVFERKSLTAARPSPSTLGTPFSLLHVTRDRLELVPIFAAPAQLAAVIDILRRNALTLISLSEHVHVFDGFLLRQINFRLTRIKGEIKFPIFR